MSPDQDNDVLEMACEELNLNKLRKYSPTGRALDMLVIGAGRYIPDYESQRSIYCPLELDLAEVERRLATIVGFDSMDEVVGFSPYSVRMLMPKFPDPEVMAAPLKKEQKHWEKFNKKRKGGRW